MLSQTFHLLNIDIECHIFSHRLKGEKTKNYDAKIKKVHQNTQSDKLFVPVRPQNI